MTHAAGSHQSAEMRSCIERCEDCHDACVEAIVYCLEQGGEHARPEHIALLLDCSQLCHTTKDSMQRGSPAHASICGCCREVCERCAESCETLGDDQQMAACARLARRCAESCAQMAG